MRRWLTLLVSIAWPAAGCSLLTDLSGLAGPTVDGDASGRDAVASEDAATEPAPPMDAAGRCDPSKPFGAPVALEALNLPTENDRAARLMPDELTIYFSSDRSNEHRIYRSTRASTAVAFGPPALVTELAAPSTQFQAAAPSASGLELIVETRLVDGGGGGDLFLATRTTPTGPFGGTTSITSIDTPQDETDPHLGGGDLELWFASLRDGSYDVFVSRRATTTTAFGPATLLAGDVNLPMASDTDPVPSADGTELYFQSDRSGPARIWVARRSSTTAPFGAPVHVTELDGTGTNDVPNWLSLDRCALYMTSSGTNGIAKLYMAMRPR